MSNYRILATRELAGPIERVEQDDGTIRYSSIAILSRGVWTDAGSGQPTEYDPAELEIADDATVNIMHDADNDVSSVGHIDAGSYTVESGTGYADIVLNMDSAASEYADENLQEALESGGEVGFGGPSIEIPANGYDLEDTGNGYPKLINGTVEGLGLVKSPASKSVSFARQTAERGVAMSDGSQTTKVYTLKGDSMSDEFDLESLREQYNLSDNVDADTIKELLEAGAFSLEEDEDEEEDEDKEKSDDEEDEEEEEEEDVENEEDDEEEEEDEMGMEELASEVAQLRSELEQIREEHEALMEAEAVEEELSAVREELADADTVQELAEAKEELDKRLSKLEDEPKDPKSLSDSGDAEDWYDADSGVSYDPASGSTSY